MQNYYLIPRKSAAFNVIFRAAMRHKRHNPAKPFLYTYEGSGEGWHYFKHCSGFPGLSFQIYRPFARIPAAWVFKSC